MNDEPIKYCLGCGIQLKQWKPGDDEFCGAYEQCIPLWELREAKVRIVAMEAALKRADELVECVIHQAEDESWQEAMLVYQAARAKAKL